MSFGNHPAFRLLYTNDPEAYRRKALWSDDRVRCLCAAAGCTNLTPWMRLDRRVHRNGVCEDCQTRRVHRICARKPQHPMLARWHDAMRRRHKTITNPEDLVAAVRRNRKHPPDTTTLRFWAKLYCRGTTTSTQTPKRVRFEDHPHIVISDDEQDEDKDAIAAKKQRVMAAVVDEPPSSSTTAVLCARCQEGRLLDKLQGPAFSDVHCKHQQRMHAVDRFRQHPRRTTAAVFALDHPLPIAMVGDGGAITEDEDGKRLFVDDLVAAGLADGCPFGPDQYFSPNINPAVCDELMRRGVRHTRCMCADLFLQRMAPVIRDEYGGLVLGFFDALGGFFGPLGPRPLLELSVNLRLYEPSAPAYVCFAVSDRYDRARCGSRLQTRIEVEQETLRILTAPISADAPQQQSRQPYDARTAVMPRDTQFVYRSMQSYHFCVADKTTSMM